MRVVQRVGVEWVAVPVVLRLLGKVAVVRDARRLVLAGIALDRSIRFHLATPLYLSAGALT